MAWRAQYLDYILVPLGMASLLAYHAYFYYRIIRYPLQTVVGLSHRDRREWVRKIMKDNEKNNLLAVQTLRNTIMGCTLMATTAILLVSMVAVFMTRSESYWTNRYMNSMESVKYMSLLSFFMFSFLCYMQSVHHINDVCFLINVPAGNTPDSVANVLAAGCNFFTMGTRGFYMACPLLLWVFGPIPVLFGCVALIPVLYHLDSVDDCVVLLKDTNAACMDF